MNNAISPHRQRIIDDMKLRNMSPATQGAYIPAVKNLSLFFGRSPNQLSFEDVRTYQLHLVSRGLQAELD
jgi:integrase/recombinase XerD